MPEIYNYNDRLTPGEKVTLERTVYFRPATDNIAPYIETNPAELERKIGASQYRERELYDRARAVLDEWAEQAGETLLLQKAIEYQFTKLPEHTGNQWVEKNDYTKEKIISNLTYRFWQNIRTCIGYERQSDGTYHRVVTGYDVSWSFGLQGVGGKLPTTFDSQFNKHYKDRDPAEKYLTGRFKKYSKYFKEIQPKLMPIYVDLFKVCGVLLPGYEMEEES